MDFRILGTRKECPYELVNYLIGINKKRLPAFEQLLNGFAAFKMFSFWVGKFQL